MSKRVFRRELQWEQKLAKDFEAGIKVVGEAYDIYHDVALPFLHAAEQRIEDRDQVSHRYSTM